MSTPEKRQVVKLSIKENVLLCNWLMAPGALMVGDTGETIAARARVELDNPRINKDHIYTRMQEFELSIPAETDMDEELLQDIRDLRAVVMALAKQHLEIHLADVVVNRALARLASRSGV